MSETQSMVKLLTNLFKLRIGVIMAITALVALVVTPGQPVPVMGPPSGSSSAVT